MCLGERQILDSDTETFLESHHRNEQNKIYWTSPYYTLNSNYSQLSLQDDITTPSFTRRKLYTATQTLRKNSLWLIYYTVFGLVELNSKENLKKLNIVQLAASFFTVLY